MVRPSHSMKEYSQYHWHFPYLSVNLKEHLDRLNVHEDSPKFGDREKLLDGFVKQGYLHRAKVGDEVRGNSDNVWEYYWGPRAKAEIYDSNIVDFITSVSHSTWHILLSFTHVVSFSEKMAWISRNFQATFINQQGKRRKHIFSIALLNDLISQCHWLVLLFRDD